MFNKNIPDRTQILLCAKHCSVLRIDLSAASKELTHEDARFIPRKTEEKKVKHFCFISGKLMSKYLERTGGSEKEPKQCSIRDVNMPEHFTPEQRRRVETICHKYKDVCIRVKSGQDSTSHEECKASRVQDEGRCEAHPQ